MKTIYITQEAIIDMLNKFCGADLPDNTQIILQDQDNKIDIAGILVNQYQEIIELFEPYVNEEKDTILCEKLGMSFLEYLENKIKNLK
jgi:hypothetical protein